MKTDTLIILGFAGVALYFVMKSRAPVGVSTPTANPTGGAPPATAGAQPDMFTSILSAATAIAKTVGDIVQSNSKNT